ncbi:MAG TPA: tetratricopeptide repeat protein [Bacteroidota bacterium]|nr:tetratricopeptide repeat protein [Bacteroidota bacterium]
MKRFSLMSLVAVSGAALLVPLPAQCREPGGKASAFAYVRNDEGDPGQTLYKSGYSDILSEQWAKARKTFADLLKRFPHSTYADDARYWSAYALMHMDKQKALAEYRQFINRHPKSAYLSDAVADLGNAERELEAAKVRREFEMMARHRGMNDSLMRDSKDRIRQAMEGDMDAENLARLSQLGVVYDSAFSQFPSFGSGIGRGFEGMNFRGLAMNMRRLGWQVRRTFGPGSSSAIDKNTQLRLEALSAIGHGEEDDRGFTTLKDVAVDRSQPVVIRLEAMDQLADFTKHDVSAVFLDLARTDSSEEIQSESLDHLCDCIKDKDKSVQTLATLYRSVPSAHGSQRSMILFEVADIGNDPAVDFLSSVAKQDTSYERRAEALYYLGNIGGEKARSVLYDVLLNK